MKNISFSTNMAGYISDEVSTSEIQQTDVIKFDKWEDPSDKIISTII